MAQSGIIDKKDLVELFLNYRKSRELSERSFRARLQGAVDRIHNFISVEDTIHNNELVSQAMVVASTRCNQHCPFCQAYRSEAEEGPSLEQLKNAGDRIARMLPGAKIILTGGEPTLRKDLQELVDHLMSLEAVGLVEVQTNAVLIGARPERFDFKPSRRLRFLVAMHGLQEEVYDRCTGTSGQLPGALEGVQRLLGMGHPVEFNCVVNKLNLNHLQEYITALPSRFGERPPPVHFSIMGAPVHPDASQLFVRFTQLQENLLAALDLSAGTGVETRVALSAWHMAVPLCILSGSLQQKVSDYPRIYEHEASDRGADPDRWWAKGPACARCRIDSYCLGLPRAYCEQFGFDELQPIG